MKNRMTAILTALLCLIAISARASQKLNLYIDKDALLAHDISAADIRIRPESMMRVLRHSLWPWDEDGLQWSMFVEVENTSEEKIVIDDTWLVACKANRDEIAAADNALRATDNVLDPGEKTVLYAGVDEWMMLTDYRDVKEDAKAEGLSEFAEKIQKAEILRIRLDTRGGESTANWPKADVDAKVRIEEGKICFEMTNDSEQVMAFHTIGVIVCDENGRLMDVLQSSYARGAMAEPGKTIVFEKALQPYITGEMAQCAQFELFAYTMPETMLHINGQ